MKHKIATVFLTAATTLCLCIGISACEMTVSGGGNGGETGGNNGNHKPSNISFGGLNFTLNEDGASYSVAGMKYGTATDIVIPSEFRGLPVTAIKGTDDWGRHSAFYYCSSLTSVVIPEGVTSIGFSAFEGCESLTSIVIPKSVTSIGQSAFCYDPPQKVYYGGTPEDWKNITIGNKGYSSDIFRPFTPPQYYYSSAEPDEAKWAESKYWWHYDPVTGEAVEWTKEE